MKKLLISLMVLFLFPLSSFSKAKTIHVFVALCDNENQGILPVPTALGNGQDPASNLYWGAMYGMKTYFRKSKNWILLKTVTKPSENILERLIFKHKTQEVYLMADAYDGKEIKQTTIDFLNACSGNFDARAKINDLELDFGGKSLLLTYLGHDGLMEFDLQESFAPKDQECRDAIILACISKDYFSPYLEKTGAYPLVWTTGFMAPEAYTVAWALEAWVMGKTAPEIQHQAAAAYNHYQKCGINGAKKLLVTGW